MANVYLILIRTSPDVWLVVIKSQIAALLPTIQRLRSSPVDRLVVFVEIGYSSYRFDWDDRPITRFLRDFDFVTNSLTLITAHPTRLTRRVDELEGLRNTFEDLDISWISLGVDPGAPQRLCNPFLPEYFNSIVENLSDMEIGVRQAGSMTLRRTRTRLRIEGPLSRGEDMPQITAIRNGLRQFCTTQGIQRILLVLRTSPTGSDDTESGGITMQRTLLGRLIPNHLPRQEIIGRGISAYSTDWHSDIAKKIRRDDVSPARKALVISTSMDRMFRRVDGYDALRQFHDRGHVFCSLLWEMPQAANTSPYSWMTGAAIAGTPQPTPAAVEFNTAVNTQRRAVTGQHKHNAIFAPISLYGHHDAVLTQMIDDHVQMAESAGKCTSGRLVSYGRPEIPLDLQHFDEPWAWPAAGQEFHDYIATHTQWQAGEITVKVRLFKCPCHEAFVRQLEWTHNLACRCSCNFCMTYSACPCPRGRPCQCPLICDCTCAHCHVGQRAATVRGESKFDAETYQLPVKQSAPDFATYGIVREQARKDANPLPNRICQKCGDLYTPMHGRIIGLCWACHRQAIDERKADPAQRRVCRAKAVHPDLCSGVGFTVKNDHGYYCITQGPDKCKEKLRAYLRRTAQPVTIDVDSESDAEHD